MKRKVILMIPVIIVLFILNAMAQWSKVMGGGLPEFTSAWNIDAYDKKTAALGVCSNGWKLVRTTDQGASWQELPYPTGEAATCENICMLESDHIWLTIGCVKIYATSNGGAAWNSKFFNLDVTSFINYLEMFNPDSGVAMGDSKWGSSGAPVFLKTTDGGQSWRSVNNMEIGGMAYTQNTSFPTFDIGYHNPNNGNAVYKTTNGGSSWFKTNYPESYMPRVVKFYDPDFGIVSSSGIYITTDGLDTWSQNTQVPTGDDIEFAPGNPAYVWLSHSNDIYASSDSGNTWVKQLTINGSADGYVRDIVFADSAYGWVLTDKALFKTRNGGGWHTAVDVDEPGVPGTINLLQNFPNPFNSETEIRYSIVQTDYARIVIYDLLGKTITVLLNERKEPGNYSIKWNGCDDMENPVPSGVYVYSLQSGRSVQSRKLLLLR